jgi:hypothetical protein
MICFLLPAACIYDIGLTQINKHQNTLKYETYIFNAELDRENAGIDQIYEVLKTS